MDWKKSFGPRVRQRLLDLGMSQEQLSKALGCASATITKALKGERGVSVSFLIATADVLKTTTDFLLGRADEPGENHSAQNNDVGD